MNGNLPNLLLTACHSFYVRDAADVDVVAQQLPLIWKLRRHRRRCLRVHDGSTPVVGEPPPPTVTSTKHTNPTLLWATSARWICGCARPRHGKKSRRGEHLRPGCAGARRA